LASCITLTFDDGPDPVWTPRVLTALERAHARATFFVMAGTAAEHPDLIDRVRAAGHAVQLHCVRHVRHTECAEREVERDTDEGLRHLGALGVKPTRWRTPWGVHAQFTPRIAAERGLELADWTADSHDWTGTAAERMLDDISHELTPGAVVLMHDGIGPGALRDGCAETVRLIDAIAGLARARAVALA